MRVLAAQSLLFLAAAVALTFTGVECQPPNLNQSIDFWSLNDIEKLTKIGQILLSNQQLTKQLFNVAHSLSWFVDGANQSPLGSALVPALLNYLPNVLNSTYLKLAVSLTLDEVSKVNVTAAMADLFMSALQMTAGKNILPFSAEFNSTFQQLVTNYLVQNVDYLRVVSRLLTYLDTRQYLYESSANVTTVNPQCYSDTMEFLTAAVGASVYSIDPANNSTRVDIERFTWALKMLDSFGKPTPGLLKGGLHYLGSFDQCTNIHAYIPNNASLIFAMKPHDYITEFDTRYCRVAFDIPDSIVQSFGVDTRGIVLRLNWGLCLPDTCHKQDVEGIFRMGALQSLNIPVHAAYCHEKKFVKDDPAAVVAIILLALLVAMVIFCTLDEAWIVFYNNNFAHPPSPTNSSIEDPEAFGKVAGSNAGAVYENQNYKPDEAERSQKAELSQTLSSSKDVTLKVMPAGYVPHKEKFPDFRDSQSAPDSVTGSDVPKNISPPPSYSKKEKKEVSRLVKAFSLVTNMPKLLSGKRSPNAVHCLHGIRFFSLTWVVLGHTYDYGIVSVVDNPTTVNLVDADAFFHRYTFQGIMAGGFAVDTFFLLSGMLVTWLTLRDMSKKKGVVYWVMFYVHRFWRLTPLYMLVLVTFYGLHLYLGSRGPLWPAEISSADNCRKYWWTNLLYVNNLVRSNDMCMGWSWYLSNDMQFYWISPILLFPMFYFASIGVALTVALMCVGIALAFYFEYQNGGDVFTMNEDGSRYWEQVYVPPWCRFAAYAVGMLLGFLFFKVKRTTLRLSTAVAGWCATWVVGLVLCYITYTKNQDGGGAWARWFEALFESFGRPLWAACIGWIIFACHNNRGGFINSILSWQGFLPLSRLTYAAYLVHPMIMIIHVYGKRAQLYIDDFDIIYLFLGHTAITFFTAFLFSLIAEAPALALEKMLFRLR